MFDSTFERSRLYFTVLQALRIFSEWIQESGRELQQLKQDFDANIQSSGTRRGSIGSSSGSESPNFFMIMKEIDEAWEKVISIHGASSKSLIDRIEKKEEEIKSFRDGVSTCLRSIYILEFANKIMYSALQCYFSARGITSNDLEPVHSSIHNRHHILSSPKLRFCTFPHHLLREITSYLIISSQVFI